MTYTTVQADTWDAIAWRQMGSTQNTNLLLKANWQWHQTLIFPAGVKLDIPEAETTPVTAPLPPWKTTAARAMAPPDVVLDASRTKYVVPKGVYPSNGVVRVEPERKIVTPSDVQQTVLPSEGKLLGSVVVRPQPGYNTTDATLTAEDLREGKIAYGKSGRIIGTMGTLPAQTVTLDAITDSYQIPAGLHGGGGSVEIHPITLVAQPELEAQSFTAPEGYVYGQVNVEAIPIQTVENGEGMEVIIGA